MTPLSVLDLSFVSADSTPARALHDTLALARHVDGLGYRRYWLAEHHALPNVASPAPEIMIGQIAAATRSIRVGSGGIMLPNHAPLMVAERFRVLEALFPGRIDLGLGRAPGTDGLTARALRRREAPGQGGNDDFLDRLQELLFWDGGFPDGHPFAKIQASPAGVPLPPIFLLGSSDYSAQLAGEIGCGFGFAQHFSGMPAEAPMLAYRRLFRPTRLGERPHAILAVAAICGATDAEAERLAASARLSTLRRERGEYRPLPSLEEALAYPYSDAEQAQIERGRDKLHVGGPETLRATLTDLVARTQADELMIVTAIPDQAARHDSYTRLAQAWGLGAVSEAA
ncbi:luciferase family oxidoreductase group 1 [Methylobacterium brachiatum]|jgi:luciferase family oxidoreductase group 1|uniref:Luciferase-like monooxygenase n=1 Tax=Methylobacterium brachiatum TaxID=269660 RepID=A0AAJ1TPA0_9HYPH|nr:MULTISPECIES: LLM class flavin-dependent oxidoreductase [Methylobacterium]MCB4801341.1 LLM class flavin-dependent oxidoreductase [Methylobacterium brachiatum]MDQ0544456.1 luciferase family oxidoreductase group 1 [Methylobacterium brachiatum]